MDEFILQLLKSSISYIGSIISKNSAKGLTKKYKFSGILNLWHDGLNSNKIKDGDKVYLNCQISPYLQLFPNNPFNNARRWNKLYESTIDVDIKKQPMSTVAFYIGSDMTIRYYKFGKYSVVGLYEQYGDIGQGILGRIETNKLLKLIPQFYDLRFVGAYASISGKISRYSTEHAFLISKIANEAHLNINFDTLTELPFVDITNISIKPKPTTLVGTPWCATTDYDDPFIVRYCQFDNESELCQCIDELNKTQNITAYFDEIRKPKQNIHTLKNFMN